jgi:hypothetical protein
MQVSHCIIDAMILTDHWRDVYGDEWHAKLAVDETHRIHPSSIAKVSYMCTSAFGVVADKLL